MLFWSYRFRLSWATSKHASAALVFVFVLQLTNAVHGQFGVGTNGDRLRRLASADDRAVVLFFVDAGCPVSDRTFPEMKRIRESFSGRGVRVWFVYPNSAAAREVEKHQREFDAGGEALLDPGGDLVRLAHARVTPEVAVLVPNGADGWKPVYTGRIDDRFVHIGLERPRATQHFAQAAIEAVLSGRPVPRATGTPVGCGIVGAGAGEGIAGAMGSMQSMAARAVGGKERP